MFFQRKAPAAWGVEYVVGPTKALCCVALCVLAGKQNTTKELFAYPTRVWLAPDAGNTIALELTRMMDRSKSARGLNVRVSQGLVLTMALSAGLELGCGTSPRYISGGSVASGNGTTSTRTSRRYRRRYARGGSGNASAAADTKTEQASSALRGQGFQAIGNQRMPMDDRRLISVTVPTQARHCYTIVAVADGGISNVDLTVINTSGRPVVSDDTAEPRAHVSFCNFNESGDFRARVFAFGGSGVVRLQAFEGPSGVTGDLSSVFGGASHSTTTTTASALATPDSETSQRIRTFEQQASSQGFQPVGTVSGTPILQNGQGVSWPAQLPAGQCYTFAIFGGAGVGDADLQLLDSAGNVVQADTQPARDANVSAFCPSADGSYRLRPTIGNGSGQLWLAVYMRGGSAGNNQLAINTRVGTATDGEAGGADSAFGDVERALEQVGYDSQDEPQEGTLEAGREERKTVALEAGKCYAIAATASSTMQDLDLFLLDPANHEVDRDYARDAKPVVRVCPQSSGNYTVRVQAAAGRGTFRLGVFNWTSGVSGAGMTGLLFVRNAEVSRVLLADGYEGDADFDLERRNIPQNEHANISVNLANGKCYAFVAVGGPGVSDLNLRVTKG